MTSEFALGPGSGRQRLGTAREIHGDSESCPFYLLVIKSLPERGVSILENNRQGKAVCYVTWQIDGREVFHDKESRQIRPRTRRIRLEWSDVQFSASYLVLVASEAGKNLDPTSQRLWESDAFFLGRYINSATKNPALVKNWLELCDHSHDKPCQIERGKDFQDMISKPYFGVIDVHQMCLTQLPPEEKYIALSYMWGHEKRYTTTLSNIQGHQDAGGLEKALPKLHRVIRDSFLLVRSLGERYLWVDSLCIVQNSPTPWELNAGVMDIVYGNAYLTICAADGEGPGLGLRGMQPERKV